MEQLHDFEEIRCFYDSDVPAHLWPLADEPHIQATLKHLLPELDMPEFVAKLKSMTTIYQFQSQVVAPFVLRLAQKSCESLTLNHVDYIDPDHAGVYITNHRDIVLDSAFLNSLLLQKGYKTAEIAIGNNLLIYPWIRDLVRLNKSFIVRRDVPGRQMLEASKTLSAYIHYTVLQKNNPVWIAQREGRSKDSSDLTQSSVIKMLAMGGSSRSLLENIMALNLHPVALSYEYDPCDYLKAREYQLKRDCPGYKKSQADDLANMSTGMLGYKGRVVLNVTPALNPQLEKLAVLTDKNKLVEAICSCVDGALHRNMVLFEINYVAYDLRFATDKYAAHYTEEQKQKAVAYLNGQLAKIELPEKDEAFLWEKLLTMYSNPVVNRERLEERL